MIPEFAIIGHPNEGKSAVVSTLAEDDSVRVTPYPGETRICQTFSVRIDHKELIRFTDTPGFQNPRKVLAWMNEYSGPANLLLAAFFKEHENNPEFMHDCELLKPVGQGAGIIYVVDGSRPLRKVDLAEMEILRLTGRPRMAIINCKEGDTSHLEKWKLEFRKNFNALRVFNAHNATYAERLELLENLKSIDQDCTAVLDVVISSFKKDWERRNHLTAEAITIMLTHCLELSIIKTFTASIDESVLKQKMEQEFSRAITQIEQNTHNSIRKLFKHNIFNYNFPQHSILHEDLFSEKTWKVLGLTSKQLIVAAGITGGAIGAVADVAAAGLTFGIFSTLGGLLGAGLAALGGGKRLANAKVVGLNVGRCQLQIGPVENIQLLYVLLDRALIFYAHVINWAHGRRDYPHPDVKDTDRAYEHMGFVKQWDERKRKICSDYYVNLRKVGAHGKEYSRKILKQMIQDMLIKISTSNINELFR